MLKFIHCGDFHLDSPFSLLDAQKATARRGMQRGAFTSLMLYARTEKIDLVLLPGDLFDTGWVTRETGALLIREFEQAPDCRFVIAPGNHDPYCDSSPYSRLRFPPNVHIFNSPMLSRFSFDDINTDVYGFAFDSDTMAVNPFAGKKPRYGDKINILCCHGDITEGASKYCPISRADIEDSGFDYIALGHVHSSDGVKKLANTYYAYSGTPEGRSFDECGKKTVILAGAEKTNGVFSAEFIQKAITKRHFEKAELDISGAETNPQIIAILNAYVVKMKYSADTSLRVTLVGEVNSSLVISPQVIEQNVCGLYYIEVRDETVPSLDTGSLENDPTIRGAFYKKLASALNSDDEQTRKTAASALRAGLNALNKL